MWIYAEVYWTTNEGRGRVSQLITRADGTDKQSVLEKIRSLCTDFVNAQTTEIMYQLTGSPRNLDARRCY